MSDEVILRSFDLAEPVSGLYRSNGSTVVYVWTNLSDEIKAQWNALMQHRRELAEFEIPSNWSGWQISNRAVLMREHDEAIARWLPQILSKHPDPINHWDENCLLWLYENVNHSEPSPFEILLNQVVDVLK